MQGTCPPWSGPSLYSGEWGNRCGLLQSGKVVGVVQDWDLRLSLQDNLVIHLLAVRATRSKWGRGRIREPR